MTHNHQFTGHVIERGASRAQVAVIGETFVVTLVQRDHAPCEISKTEIVQLVHNAGIPWFREHMLVWPGEHMHMYDGNIHFALIASVREQYVDPDDTDDPAVLEEEIRRNNILLRQHPNPNMQRLGVLLDELMACLKDGA